LRQKQESHFWPKKKDSEIATEIGSHLKIQIDTDSTAAAKEEPENLFQDNQYPIVFLLERARVRGYVLVVREEAANNKAKQPKLYFGPSENLRKEIYKIKYGLSMVDFQPTLTTANQVGQVTVRAWDSVKGEPIEETATLSDLPTKGVGGAGRQPVLEAAFNQREEVIANEPVQSKDEAKSLALRTLVNIAKDMIKGTGTVPGLPDLRAGTVIFLDGMGDRFSGYYFVTATTHTIGDGGYTTQFECRREEPKKGRA
jgi:phage protein D